METSVSVLGSMATRGLLAELASAWEGHATVEATGGVDAARRVRDGETLDVVVLADAVMRNLEAEGHIVPGSLAGIARAAVAVAVRDGEPIPDPWHADAVKEAVLAAGRVGYSTGPSGDHLLRLLEGWGIRDTLGDRLVQAPPGVPVGRLLVERAVDLAVQQRSELLGQPGVMVVGKLPPEIARDTVFTAGLAQTSTRPEAARRLISFLASAAADEARLRHGLEPI